MRTITHMPRRLRNDEDILNVTPRADMSSGWVPACGTDLIGTGVKSPFSASA